jgi:MOSC domain-containing protein YiiM/predicted GNAT family acetyltransferase
MSEPQAAGRVLQVSVSPGGVPKHAVHEARIGRLGLVGDRHRGDTVHGGPHRAVCLFAIEALYRVADEGHPIEPGSVGENLTTEGIELALLPAGTRLAIGPDVILEMSGPTNPCDNIAASFHDGRSGRISILTHPTDSRMYARTLSEGVVRPGDPIRVLPPLEGSLAETHALLDRLDSVNTAAEVAIWTSARAAGHDIRIVDDGELVMAAAPALPGPPFNEAHGYRSLPNLLDRMLDHFRRHRTVGWIRAEEPPWPGAEPDGRGVLLVADAEALAENVVRSRPRSVQGLEIAAVGREEAPAWARLLVEWSAIDPAVAPAWIDLAPFLADSPGSHLLAATLDGQPAAVSGLFTRRRVGLLRTTAVAPVFRGRGIQRALIAHRVQRAVELGCTLIHAGATEDSVSQRNLEAMGLEVIWRRHRFRFDPAEPPAGLLP